MVDKQIDTENCMRSGKADDTNKKKVIRDSLGQVAKSWMLRTGLFDCPAEEQLTDQKSLSCKAYFTNGINRTNPGCFESALNLQITEFGLKTLLMLIKIHPSLCKFPEPYTT